MYRGPARDFRQAVSRTATGAWQCLVHAILTSPLQRLRRNGDSQAQLDQAQLVTFDQAVFWGSCHGVHAMAELV